MRRGGGAAARAPSSSSSMCGSPGSDPGGRRMVGPRAAGGAADGVTLEARPNSSGGRSARKRGRLHRAIGRAALAVADAAAREREREPPLRARHAHVAEPPLLVLGRRAPPGRVGPGALVRERPILQAGEEHRLELQPLRGVQRHEETRPPASRRPPRRGARSARGSGRAAADGPPPDRAAARRGRLAELARGGHELDEILGLLDRLVGVLRLEPREHARALQHLLHGDARVERRDVRGEPGDERVELGERAAGGGRILHGVALGEGVEERDSPRGGVARSRSTVLSPMPRGGRFTTRSRSRSLRGESASRR